jgi:hypothetical protein
MEKLSKENGFSLMELILPENLKKINLKEKDYGILLTEM